VQVTANGTRLSFFDDGLTSLSLDVTRFASVEILDLNGNHLTTLPPEIGQLANLQIIYLGGNRLESLPPEIGNLQKLHTLCIDRNQLEELPPEIGQLHSLQLLRVENNKLTALPRELAELLRRGLSITLDSNPFRDPLPELISRGLDSVASYLSSLDDARAQYEAKVLLVGEGNVGKTSLVAALRGDKFIEGRDTTHGIEIYQFSLPHPELKVPMTIRMWDFGGQEVYRVTHQFFYSARTLYIVVWKTREGREENAVEGWLRRIMLRVGRDAQVLVVATYGDERRPELDYPQLKRLFPEILMGEHTVDNQSGNGIPQLRKGIAYQVSALPQMGQLLSSRWIAARREILAWAGKKPQISYDMLKKICNRHGMQDSEVVTLVELMHDLGYVIYYGDDEGLRDIVVLNPEWLTKAIGYVLEDASTRAAHGILDHRRLKEIWSNRRHGISYSSSYHPYFLRLMEKFDVSYRLAHDSSRSLIAQLVPFERPTLPWESGTNAA
jgi:internalin A